MFPLRCGSEMQDTVITHATVVTIRERNSVAGAIFRLGGGAGVGKSAARILFRGETEAMTKKHLKVITSFLM